MYYEVEWGFDGSRSNNRLQIHLGTFELRGFAFGN